MLWRRRKQREQDLERELHSDLELEAEEHRENGLSPEEASYAARRALGNITLTKEEVLQMWGWTHLELVLRDMRFALRQMRRNPGLTAVAILSLGLGVGGNTAIFSIVKAMLLAPLPYPEGDRLVMVWEDVPRWDIPRNTPAPANFLDWRQQNHVFESMAAFMGGIFGDMALTGVGEPEQIHGAQVSSNFFRVLRVRPALGSDFQDNDDQTGARIAIISDSLWRRHFAASGSVIGR